ncbi:ATP-binding protein [Streptomyces sp. SID12501]|uniref:ATP-binding protein n=1 Tax=Streptomyces sp. SID12501 TaxID=2706042 RepID=A0A6B3C159_9ACTN|nr:ATP-binding protein [Streptomyces sp. SID12501]NEC90389.1 ATP-binding protein [Streptomyces sp. SID12501]
MIERRRGAVPVRCALPTSPAPILLLPGKAESARAAREFVREHMGHHAPDASEDYVENVVLVACELVTNSIRYGTEPGDQIRLVLDANDACTRVEVHDPVRRHPRVRPESHERDRGRGLVILDALCPERWGVIDVVFGKVVFGEVTAS